MLWPIIGRPIIGANNQPIISRLPIVYFRVHLLSIKVHGTIFEIE